MKQKGSNKQAGKGIAKKILRLLIVLLIIGAGAAALFFFGGLGGKSQGVGAKAGVFDVRRSDLTISITENGTVKPLNSRDIISKVQGNTTIISIVDEGTVITEEDVKNGKILVELDSAAIKEDVTEEEIKLLDGKADFTAATEALDIQKKQNESDVEAGRLNVRFALMDLQKYLGEKISEKLISRAIGSSASAVANAIIDSNVPVNSISSIDIDPDVLINDPDLGGEALQELRMLNSNITLTDAKLARAVDKFEGTKELYDANYVAEIELKGDELDVDSLKIQKNQDETAKALFVKYTFPKETVRLLSAYYESQRELERIEAKARSTFAQVMAKYETEKAKYTLQVEELKFAQMMLEACTIRAPSSGEVVYASSTESRGRRSSPEPIEVGATIRERQRLITIPDTSQMKVEIKIHETWVDKVAVGQHANIVVSAFPEDVYTGKVIRQAPMADPESWLNPDLKVYSTEVSLEGTNDSVKTGMSAKVEIILNELKNIISVPIQSVVNVQGQKVCYVATSDKPEKRVVETGAFNDDFVEIKRGLREGEKVLLNPPRLYGEDSSEGSKGKKGKDGKTRKNSGGNNRDEKKKRPGNAEK